MAGQSCMRTTGEHGLLTCLGLTVFVLMQATKERDVEEQRKLSQCKEACFRWLTRQWFCSVG